MILTFRPRGESGRIQLVHANVADRDVTEGWRKYYGRQPWRAYLANARRVR